VLRETDLVTAFARCAGPAPHHRLVLGAGLDPVAVYAMLARLAPEADLCAAFAAECAGGRRLGQLCKLCTKVRI
jgi:hypothetical protein